MQISERNQWLLRKELHDGRHAIRIEDEEELKVLAEDGGLCLRWRFLWLLLHR